MRAAAILVLLFLAMAMSVAEMDPRMARSNRFVVNSMPVWTRFCNVRSVQPTLPNASPKLLPERNLPVRSLRQVRLQPRQAGAVLPDQRMPNCW